MVSKLVYDGVFEDDLEDETISNKFLNGNQKMIKIKNVTFENCFFKNVNFDNIEFDGVDFVDVVFENCDLSNKKFD